MISVNCSGKSAQIEKGSNIFQALKALEAEHGLEMGRGLDQQNAHEVVLRRLRHSPPLEPDQIALGAAELHPDQGHRLAGVFLGSGNCDGKVGFIEPDQGGGEWIHTKRSGPRGSGNSTH